MVALPQRWATDSLMDRFLCSFERSRDSDCWLWDGDLKKTGYGQMCAFGKHNAAHRMAYMLFKGPIPEGLHVLHSCDVRNCVNPDHLRAGTHRENMADMVTKGRRKGPQGSNAPWAILTDDRVREIRGSSETGTVLAERFGVSKSAIYNVRNRCSWRNVE